IQRTGEWALSSAAARALATSTAWYVAGDRARALAVVERDQDDLGDDPALRVAWLIQKAELLAGAGRRDEAGRSAGAAARGAAGRGGALGGGRRRGGGGARRPRARGARALDALGARPSRWGAPP